MTGREAVLLHYEGCLFKVITLLTDAHLELLEMYPAPDDVALVEAVTLVTHSLVNSVERLKDELILTMRERGEEEAK